MTKWILITGGIGSGKTTVSDLFSQLGVDVIDTDVISRELTQHNGQALFLIREYFGPQSIDDNHALNRKWMRDKIFNDHSAKITLEAILHPIIFEKVIILQKQKNNGLYGLIAVPVFSKDSIYNSIIDRILVVDVDQSIQVARVQARSCLTSEEINQIIASQLSREERNQLADDMIINNQGLDDLKEQVWQLHQKYKKLFSNTQ